MHPREFGKYRILKLLPRGGMGTVYLAVDTQLNYQVALKLIEQGPDQDRLEIAAAERRGAMLQEQLCRLDSRVTPIRSWGELEGFFYIEMEYIEGHDLAELLRTGPLGIPFAARIGADLCEVLQHAHTLTLTIEGHQYRGVVHGDIKPRNIRITPSGEVRVLDFGISKALSLTREFTHIQFGSSQYSSPERLLHGEVDVASDLWAVAVVLYEIITAHPYFEADSGPKLEHLVRNYREIRPLPPNIPYPFAAILRKALHPVEEARYSTAEAFSSDLRAYLAGQPTVAESMRAEEFDSEATRRTSVPVGEAEDFDDAATRRTAQPSPAPPRTRKRLKGFTQQQRKYAFAAILAVLVFFAGVIWHEVGIWRQGDALALELKTERLTDLNAAWARYQELQDQNHLPLILYSPRRTILDKLTATADHAILEFRNAEAPTVNENDWVRAQEALAKALQLDPNDKEIRGKMYIAEGHIARIRGSSRVSGKLLSEARSKFEQAHELMPKSPDPYIGLARLYTYSLHDVDKAEDAINQASKRGKEIGRREKAQLADGYRDRAERLMREADRATGLPEEKDYLERARTDFGRAEELYRTIVPFGGSASSLRKVLEYTDNVGIRLRAIREGA